MTSILYSLQLLGDVVPPPGANAGPLAAWALAFGLTLILECSIVALVWRLRGRRDSLRAWLLAALIVNAVSHPIATSLWYVLPLPWSGPYTLPWFCVIEVAVIAFETWGYRRLRACPWQTAAITSLAANLVTGILGACYGFVL